jgi:hypothetical protein
LGGRVKHKTNGREKEKFKTYLNGDRGRSLKVMGGRVRKKNRLGGRVKHQKNGREKDKFKTYLSRDRGRSL